MFDNKITNLSLLEKYELDIHIKFDNQIPINGKLSQSINLNFSLC